MPLPPENARPDFVRHVAERLAKLRAELPKVFPAEKMPIVLEIGCGHGHFLTAYAAAHPERFCVGIDIIRERLVRARRKQSAARLKNLAFVGAEAGEFLECLPEGLRFADVFILFPDPWPKKRHHKNRLMQEAFLAALAAKMAPGGKLFFRTDHGEYAAWTHERLAENKHWELLTHAPWPFELATVFQQRAEGYQSFVAQLRSSGT